MSKTAKMPRANDNEVAFVKSIANPVEVLEIVEKTQKQIEEATKNGATGLEIGTIVGSGWLEIAELEGDVIANEIIDTKWPLDGSTLAAA